MRVSPSDLARIDKHMRHYAELLGIAEAPLPTVSIHNRLAAGWLAQHEYLFREKRSLLRVQAQVIPDDRTLERVIAHEMIHHWQAVKMTDEDLYKILSLLKVGVKPDGHGKDFLKQAAAINSVKGPNFVTVTSDSEYVSAAPSKPFYVLIADVFGDGRLGYAWAAKVSPQAAPWVRDKVASGRAKLVTTTNRRWTQTKAKIQKHAAFAMPSSAEDKAELARLYREGQVADLP